jgi:hypothetical protein
MSNKPKRPGIGIIKTGGWLMLSGLLFALSPLVLAFLATKPGHNPWSEGDSQSGGTYLWAMLATLPLGTIITLAGFIVLMVGLVKRSNN